MSSKSAPPPPSIQRMRPIDASGLLWSIVSILAGYFYAGTFSPVFYFVFGTFAALGVLWQFRIWSSDSAVNRQATEWCRVHYPEYGGTPVVDLMVGLANVLDINFAILSPSSPLVDLVLPLDGRNDNPFVRLPDMLQCVVFEARIRKIDCSSFAGSTLDDAIRFVVTSCNKRKAPKIPLSQ